MYIPRPFAEQRLAALHDLIRANAFGTLVTSHAGSPFASHVPFLLDPERGPCGCLTAHVARANPQWRSFADGGEALAIFAGVHAYVSPTDYGTPGNVPTWNYEAVHAYGRPRAVDDPDAVRAAIERLTALYESDRAAPWRPAHEGPEFITGLLRALVVFEMPIERLEGKRKLSQNKRPDERRAAIAALRRRDDPASHALARAMAEVLDAGT